MKARLPKTTRPTTGRAREALFNLLQSRIELENAACLDLFSGTGAVALQCAERGAKIVHAVEIHRNLARQLQEKLSKYSEIQTHVFAVDALAFLRCEQNTYDFVFADPPYAMPNKDKLVAQCLNVLNDEGLVALEHPFYENYDGVAGFVESRRYGLGAFSFFRQPADDFVG